MNEFIYEKKILKTESFEVVFQHDINCVLKIDNMFLVLLKIPLGSNEVDNLFGVDLEGHIKWRIQNANEAFGTLKNTPYVLISAVDNQTVKVTSFFGLRFTVSITDGKLHDIEHIRW